MSTFVRYKMEGMLNISATYLNWRHFEPSWSTWSGPRGSSTLISLSLRRFPKCHLNLILMLFLLVRDQKGV